MRRSELILFILVFGVATFFVQWTGAEQRSFLALTLSLHNERSLRIDRYAELTPDKAFYNGHYYTDKAPGLSFMGLPVYAAAAMLQPLDRRGLWIGYPVYLLSAALAAFPGALMALMVRRLIRRMRGSDVEATLVAATLALGTLALPFSTMLFSHQMAAFIGFAAFFILTMGQSRRLSRAQRFLGAGGLAGIATVVEYPMVLIAAALAVYALVISGRRGFALYMAGGLPAAVALMLYNTTTFGHPLALSYLYETNLWAQIHQQGVLGIGLPQWSTFLEVILGPRGLFTLSPVLLLSLYGLGAAIRDRGTRREGILAMILVGAYILITAGYRVPPTSVWVPGPRFLIPVLPFLALPLWYALRRWPALYLLTMAVSIALMLTVTAANPQVPPEVANPLLETWLPGLLDRSSLVRTLPSLRYGISRRLSLALLLLFMALGVATWGVTWLASHQRRPVWQRISLALTVIMMLLWLLVAFPIDIWAPTRLPRTLDAPVAQLLWLGGRL
jgi:hypothetical protein